MPLHYIPLDEGQHGIPSPKGEATYTQKGSEEGEEKGRHRGRG